MLYSPVDRLGWFLVMGPLWDGIIRTRSFPTDDGRRCTIDKFKTLVDGVEIKKRRARNVSSFLSPNAQQWDIILLVVCVYNTYYIEHNSSYAYYILCASAHTQTRAHGVSLLRSQNQYNVSLWFIRHGGRFEMSGSRLIFSAVEWERVRERDRVGERVREWVRERSITGAHKSP